MSTAIGTIVNGGEPHIISNPEGTSGTQDRITEPEIINGFDAYEPDTERIRTANGDGGGTTGRRTKSGKLDRRTRAGRAAAGESTGEEKESSYLGRLDLAEAIYGLHLTLSNVLPEMELDKDESEHLAKACKDLGRYYAMTFDPKKVAWFNFCAALGSVYVPRAITLRNRLKTTKPKSTVTEINKKPPAGSGGNPSPFDNLPSFESGAIE